MRLNQHHLTVLLCLILNPTPLAAETADVVPSVHLMACKSQCANFVSAKPIVDDAPSFPSNQIGWYRVYTEGILQLLYTIGPDGKVGDDISVPYLIGPKEFADIAKAKIKTWRFEPATSDGKKVAQSQLTTFQYNGWPNLRPLEVAQVMRDYPGLVEAGKVEQARARLEDVLQNVRLGFGDRGDVAAPLADMAYRRGDYLEARRLAMMVTIPPARLAAQKSAWLTLIKADLMLGEVADALIQFELLQKRVGTFAQDSALPRLMQTARANVDGQPRLTVQAQIPRIEGGDTYSFVPYRRGISFQAAEDVLQEFVLSCDQATMKSKITAGTQWRIPDDWGGCTMYIHGQPGAKFLVLQTNG